MQWRVIASAQRRHAACTPRHQILSYVMNSSEALNTIHEMIRGFSAALPRLILAVVIAVFFYFLSSAVKAAVRRSTSGDSSHRTLRLAMGRIVQGAIIIIAMLVQRTLMRRS